MLRIALSGDFRKTDGLAVYPDFDLKPQFSIDKLAAVSRFYSDGRIIATAVARRVPLARHRNRQKYRALF